MKINFTKIALDISQNNEIYETFIREFPQNKTNIDEIKQKPRCGGCISKNLQEIFNNENISSVLKNIYGEDNEIDMSIPKPMTFSTNFVVDEIDPENYLIWLNENVKIDEKSRTQIFDVFFNTKKNKMTVSRMIIVPQQ